MLTVQSVSSTTLNSLYLINHARPIEVIEFEGMYSYTVQKSNKKLRVWYYRLLALVLQNVTYNKGSDCQQEGGYLVWNDELISVNLWTPDNPEVVS